HIRDHFSRYVLDDIEDLPDFAGGAIGIMNFECAAWREPRLRALLPSSDTEAAFMFYRTIVAFDHAKQLIKIITLAFSDDPGNAKPSLKVLNSAQLTNRSIRERLESDPVILPKEDVPTSRHKVSSNLSKIDFEAGVEKVKELIAGGEVYQVVLSQCLSKRTSASPVSIYRAMRSLNPSPYMFLINTPTAAIIGSSPEMLVRCRRNSVEYRPIAGTRPRGRTALEDEQFASELREDEKEVAEHTMLVDLGRNDLGRIAEFGSVRVDELMKVEKYSHVQHLVSNLSAELREGLDRFDALISCFPAGTVSGAPKIRAIEVISDLEPTRRGIYAGSVGYFDYSGNMDTCIAIRTLVLEDGIAKVQAGAGIVADSKPEAEYKETLAKAEALLKAVAIAESKSL
ncbi:MAG: anthranilate synthase component I family protein, partial [Pyrinomonadaceae bacterium]